MTADNAGTDDELVPSPIVEQLGERGVRLSQEQEEGARSGGPRSEPHTEAEDSSWWRLKSSERTVLTTIVDIVGFLSAVGTFVALGLLAGTGLLLISGAIAAVVVVVALAMQRLGMAGDGARRRRLLRFVFGGLVVMVVAAGFLVHRVTSATATVPSLIGKSPDQACKDLRSARLACEPNDSEATREVNVVHEQSHPPGATRRKGTAVRYRYESTAALPMLRYQAPPPDTANLISMGGPAPRGWTNRPSPGWGYAPGEDGVPGLVPIYRYRCTGGCVEKLVYFLSRSADKQGNWAYEEEAFRCFDPASPPPGTRPLHRLMNKEHARWWAVPGTAEHRQATTAGFRDPSPDDPLCYVW